MAAQTKPNVVTAGANSSQKILSANAVIYPNPAGQTFTIKAEGVFTYTIHNMLGVKIASGKGKNQAEVVSSDSGVFIVTVQSEKGTSTIKLIKD